MEFRVTPRSLAGRGVRVYTLRIPQGHPRGPSQPPSSSPGGQSASCPPLDEPLTRRGGGRLRAGQALDLLGSPARSLGGPRGPPSSVATTQQAKRAERINKALNFALGVIQLQLQYGRFWSISRNGTRRENLRLYGGRAGVFAWSRRGCFLLMG